MYNKKIVNLEIMKALTEVFTRLNCLRRWTSVISDDRYNEMQKQSLNCIIASMLAMYSKEHGKTIIEERLPKIALYRAFQKVNLYFDTPDYIRSQVCDIGNISSDNFYTATRDIIVELTNEDFASFICEGTGTYEMELYKAATKIATLVEFKEIAHFMNDADHFDKLTEIQTSLEKYFYIPGVKEFSDIHGIFFKLFSNFSKLRNQPRWSVQPYTKSCLDFGHLFSTATLGYLSTLEYTNGDEKHATKLFKHGLFHDIPEVWTTDFPSPVKKRIPGLRQALKLFEKICLKKHVYDKLPKYMNSEIHSIMEVDEKSLDFKLLKGADYLSADVECYIIYVAGCRHPYMYKSAILGFEKDLQENRYILSESCRQLHDKIREFAKKVIIEL